MKLKAHCSIQVLAMFLGWHAAAQTVRYVDLNNANPTEPYTNWTTAATSIQDAIDVASAGDEIVVTNGVYLNGGRAVSAAGPTTNRVAVSKPVTLRSVNGPVFTVIQGSQVSGDDAVRCVYLASGAILSGFTLTNGSTTTGSGGLGPLYEQSGAGVWCASFDAVVSNCVVVGNAARSSGGGAYQGTLINSTLAGNSAAMGGGANSSLLSNCILSGNTAGNYGGGVAQRLRNETSLTLMWIAEQLQMGTRKPAYEAVIRSR